MVKTCNGILSTSAFPEVAEWMMSLSGFNQVRQRDSDYRFPGHPQDTARALDVLARISNGSLKAAKLVGGAECGFIAAVAHWFFEIDVEFQRADGTILQKRQQPYGNPLLLVIFDKKIEAQPRLKPMIASETYVIHDIEGKLLRQDGMRDTTIGGRLPWETVLQYTFGKSFDRLIEQAENFAAAIGSAARIFEGISRAEPYSDISHEFLGWCGYRDENYGRGYINAIADNFPELSGLRSRAESAMTKNLEDAIAKYEVARERLVIICNCEACTRGTSKEYTF